MNELLQNDVNNIKLFFSHLNHSDWVSIIGSLGGAVIAAIVSLFVVSIQNSNDIKKEVTKVYNTEQSKLRYLHFLLEDTYKIISFYDARTIELVNSYKKNPFVLQSFPIAPPNSLEAIANKINQEEYYLASVNQLNSYKVADLLLRCNLLHYQYTNALEHHKKESAELVADKDKLFNSILNLFDQIEDYMNVISRRLPVHNEMVIYRQLEALMEAIDSIREENSNRDSWMFQTKSLLIDPAIEVLSTRDATDTYGQSKLIRPLKNVELEFDSFQSYTYNVVEALEANRIRMNDQVKSIMELAGPLNTYIHGQQLEQGN